MELFIWLIITVGVSVLFTGMGIFAWRREKPMWFWSGTEVDKDEITDVPAYNRANGIMWLAFSGVFWLSAVLGVASISAAGVVLAVGCLAGIPILAVVYGRIYAGYKK